MLCDRCQKYPATVCLTKIINGEKTEINLCSHCAVESEKYYVEKEVAFQNFLSGLLDIVSKQPDHLTEKNVIACKSCGMTYQNFKKTGKIGCANCYSTFNLFLPQILRRIHGNNSHTGKIPKKTQSALIVKRTLKELRDQLKIAIENEHFEEAARLRDKIKELDKGEATT